MKPLELVLSLDDADDETKRTELAARKLKVAPNRIKAIRVRKRSLDARTRDIKIRLQVDVYLDKVPAESEPIKPLYKEVSSSRQVVVVGSGPAGLFAALRLIELGIKPLVLERGKDVQSRRHDLAAITRRGEVDPNSNYCFGEGGAGTYSDGKLYTRATKRGDVEGILRTLVAHGAPEDILIDAHPHIGSNRLPKVVAAMRESILKAGGALRFNARVEDFLLETRGDQTHIRGVKLHDGSEVCGDAVILATGHSARDVFEICVRRGVALEAKPFALGVRIEHPQPLIDRIQYRQNPEQTERDVRLPAASYRLATTVENRGVFSFCMCPGGWIVPSATAGDEVVVNGMSLSRRDSPFANSGLVVSVEAEDLEPFEKHGALAGIAYQKSLETLACQAGGGAQRAPAQRVADFLVNRTSENLPASSYQPGITSAPLNALLPASLVGRLQGGLHEFGRLMRGYTDGDAVLVGVETRTSSPVRLPRDASLQHTQVRGLFPCGEGAGFAGGIVSAAMDGVRVAQACKEVLA